MGTGASKDMGSARDPFRIDRETDRDLDTLTLVTTRILNTPDIYDVNNLSKMGTCGEYAVFMKDVIEKKLLNPFVVDTRDGMKEVVYQNPRKLIAKPEDRKEICSQIARAAITAVTTIVACLASIQVAYAPRVVPPQTGGGGLPAVSPWLSTNKVVLTAPIAKAPAEMVVTGAQMAAGTKLFLILEESRHGLTTGIVAIRNNKLSAAIQSEAFRIHFLDPIIISSFPQQQKSVLPVRILDTAGRAWMAGILVEGSGNDIVFKSFTKASETYKITEIVENLFRRSAGEVGVPILEDRTQLTAASGVFDQIRSAPSTAEASRILNTALADYFARLGITVSAAPSYYPGFPPAPGYGYGAPQPPAYVPPPPPPVQLAQPTTSYLAPVPGATTGAAPALRTYAALAGLAPGAPGAAPADVTFDVPQNSTAYILGAYKRFREAYNNQSSPATVRAKTLAASVNEDRSVTVGACQDPYWKENTLAQVYPWVTLQYLCIKDLTAAAADATRPLQFTDEWSEFLEKLRTIYDRLGLKIEGAAGGPDVLERLSVKGVAALSFCKDPKVGYRVIQDGLLRIQGLYEEHVASMWAILNNLIVVIEDPSRGARIVRLHPKATTGTQSSLKYIEARAAEARKAITKFYLDVEREYVDTLVKARE
jgi:hypothetical protein